MNENNTRYLFEGISADVVRYLVERDGMDLPEAISWVVLVHIFFSIFIAASV